MLLIIAGFICASYVEARRLLYLNFPVESEILPLILIVQNLVLAFILRGWIFKS
jgi:hypothetical protein